MLISGCATGSAVVTGNTREPVDVEKVKIYSEPPENFEVIGIVTATSEDGWTEQQKLDLAIKELKKQAGKLGANGVIIESVGMTNTGSVFFSNINYAASVTGQTVSGKAIYVIE